MANAIDPIKIKGLVEFQRALKAIDGEAQKQLRVVFNRVAETVAGGARRRVPRGKSGKAQGSVKVASSQREAIVKGGGARVPYYPWLDFGGTVGKGRTGLGGTASALERRPGAAGTAGSVRRPFLERGRYIYPSYDANRDSIYPALEKALVDLVRAAGLEVD